MLDEVPVVFKSFLSEPAFSMKDATFCIWRTNQDVAWRVGTIDFPGDPGDDPDGSQDLLFILDGDPETYKKWAAEYYERSVSLSALQRIYAHEPLTAQLVNELNPKIKSDAMLADARNMPYKL